MRTMPSRLLHSLLGLAALFLALASCSPAAPAPQAGGGIGGTGSVTTVSSGPVTKFGSVFVSGTEYDNTNTLYCIDHEPCSTVNRLKIGMVVLVNGTRTVEYGSNNSLIHVADTITYEETVEGVVQSAAADGLSLVVLGQAVSVNLKTEIDPSLQGTTLHVLDPAKVINSLVEISGFVTGDGTILATLIQPHTGLPHYEVEGVIKNHDRFAKTFEIGSLIVDYSRPATDLSQMLSSTNQSWNGLVVFVLGDQWSPGGPGPHGARMNATSVKPKTLGVSDIQDTEVEDFVTRVDGPGDFYLNNVHVRTDTGTAFEGGTINDILVGSHLEVSGPLRNGILTAANVEFEDEVEIVANIENATLATNSLTLLGLTGLTVIFDGRTTLSGQGSPRTIGDLRSGDHMQIHGRLRGNGILLAKEVERSDPSSHVQVEGYVTNAADPWLTLLGSTIDTASIPDGGFRGRSGTIGRSTFFTGLGYGEKVTLQGRVIGTQVVWTAARRAM
jgi:hypothetical protein